jgi:hypothetical protein
MERVFIGCQSASDRAPDRHPRRGRSGFFPDPCRYIKPLCNEWIALSIIRPALDVFGRCAFVRAEAKEMLT